MQRDVPSQTALRVALRRAAHQLYDSPLVLVDSVAVSILEPAYAAELRKTPNPEPEQKQRAYSVAMRAHVVARSRYAEDQLAQAVGLQAAIAGDGLALECPAEDGSPLEQGGVAVQYVLLGAGLDTFAHRNPYADVSVFEVDHPATQAWKRELLVQVKRAEPERLVYAPVDFECESLRDGLARVGFDFSTTTVFAWLGVVPYLTLEAFRSTVSLIQAMPAGSGVIFDYGQPRHVLSATEQLERDSLAARVAAVGEPFQLFFTPEELAGELHAFRRIEDLGMDELNARYFAGRSDRLRVMGPARLLSAWL